MDSSTPAEILEGLSDGVVLFSRDWRITFLNDAARRIAAPFARGPEPLEGRNHWEAFPEARGTVLEREYQRAAAERVAVEFEYFHEPHAHWFSIRVFPIGTDELCVIFRDIHPDKMRELALNRREELLRTKYGEMETIYRTVPLGLAVLGLDLRFQRINDYLARINGPTPAEHVGREVRDLLPWALELVTKVRDEVLRTGEPVRFDLEGPDPRDPRHLRVWDELWYPLRDDQGTIVALGVVVQEVTEQKLRERRLSAEAMMLADAMPQLVWTANPDGTVDYYNARLSAYAGAARTESGSWQWTPMLHPDDVAPTSERWQWATARGVIYAHTHRLQMQDGSYRWHLSRAVPVHDAAGKLIKWFGTATDIDEQKRLEETLEQTVRQRTARLEETIAELEAFSYSISHDMRAPLRAMQTFARYLEQQYGQVIEGDGQFYVARIIAAADRLDRLIQDVLAYSRISGGELALEPIDVGALVHEIVATYPQFREADIEVEKVPRVLANKAALTQVLSNLIGNAVKFVPRDSRPNVQISGQSRGGTVEVRIKDNGIGIPREERTKIFDIFYQLDRQAGGTGIGLSIVRKAAERMGGTVLVEESSPAGTTFRLELPRAK